MIIIKPQFRISPVWAGWKADEEKREFCNHGKHGFLGQIFIDLPIAQTIRTPTIEMNGAF